MLQFWRGAKEERHDYTVVGCTELSVVSRQMRIFLSPLRVGRKKMTEILQTNVEKGEWQREREGERERDNFRGRWKQKG